MIQGKTDYAPDCCLTVDEYVSYAMAIIGKVYLWSHILSFDNYISSSRKYNLTIIMKLYLACAFVMATFAPFADALGMNDRAICDKYPGKPSLKGSSRVFKCKRSSLSTFLPSSLNIKQIPTFGRSYSCLERLLPNVSLRISISRVVSLFLLMQHLGQHLLRLSRRCRSGGVCWRCL